MEYTSTLANMLYNPNHQNYSDIHYNSDHYCYRFKDNTVYQFTSVWGYEIREWLKGEGIVVPDDRRLYTPVAKLVEGKLIGYNTQYPNVGNKFLEMNDATREIYFPNLHFVEVGNHPYPKEARYHHSWLVEAYHKDCHQIVNPPSDPQEFFVQPSFFPPLLPPQ